MSGLMSINDAGEIRARFGYRAMIVIGVREAGTVDVMSHARDRADCSVIGDYAQQQFGACLPLATFQTWFGWRSAGLFLAFDAQELARLSDAGRAYAEVSTDLNAVQP